ncbi:MAG: lipopolysaccharide assembly protein LapA domain-containing protein [Actinomycetota bacterium]
MRRQGDRSDGQDERPDEGGRRRAVSVAQVVAVIAVILLIIFAIANSRRVDVNFLFFTARARVVTVIVLSAILGFAIGYYVGRPGRADRKLLRDLRQRKD